MPTGSEYLGRLQHGIEATDAEAKLGNHDGFELARTTNLRQALAMLPRLARWSALLLVLPGVRMVLFPDCSHVREAEVRRSYRKFSYFNSNTVASVCWLNRTISS